MEQRRKISSKSSDRTTSKNHLLSSFTTRLTSNTTMGGMGDDFAFTNMNSLQYLPHEGNLCRVVEEDSSAPSSYVIEIVTATTCPLSRNPKDLLLLDASTPETPTSIAIAQTHELHFTRQDFEFASRLFSILDTESSNVVHRSVVQDFVHKRCPVFSKRDDDLFRLGLPLMRRRPKNSTSSLEDPVTAVSGQTNSSHFSPTFDEVWTSVVACSRQSLCLSSSSSSSIEEASYIGVEGWLVFFRFIAFAQYLEAKRRFSARHLQQTMRHRNAPRGSEMVVVDVPPPEPPTPISPELLALHEQQSKKSLPPPELDLDHSLLAAHDAHNQRRRLRSIHENHGEQQGMPSHCVAGRVKVVLFGSPKSPIVLQQPSPSSSSLEFAVSYQRKSLGLSGTMPDEIVVRRSMSDMMWLDETFTSHKVLGGTLCGRILPPFHALSTSGGVILSPHHFGSSSDESRFMNSKTSTNTTGALHAAAAAGVGRIRDAAKSFMGPIGSYWASSSTETNTDDSTISTPTVTHSTSTHKKVSKIKRSLNFCLPELYYKPNSSEGRARQLERYLNYLLEHPALSTSFPLNAILTASQSGLEAARRSLDDYSRAAKELQSQTPSMDDGRLGVSMSPSFAWVRTAAQAAVALQVHGILENTGMQAASARLQHASLPALGSAGRSSGWDETDPDPGSPDGRDGIGADRATANQAVHNFEEGVVHDDGFDLLPLPIPAPERRILTVGSSPCLPSRETFGEERFHYGGGDLEGRHPLDYQDNEASAYLGDIAVDENIDKLREVIGSVDNTLCRCLVSSGGIGKANTERLIIHLNIIRGLDSWEGMRGKFISQRPLMKGIAGVEQSKDIFEESDLTLLDDLSWQASLANAAVMAAEDVRVAVRVSRTAANARAATSSAAFSAQSACERGEFLNLDEARAAQTRVSISQSHAIHAAVVEHEAKTVKRRATLALAHDVKTWNVHRKREMLRLCLEQARSKHEATRRSVDAWSTLRDGFIGTPVNPSVVERRPISTTQPALETRPPVDPGEATTRIYDSVFFSCQDERHSEIIPVDHNVLATSTGIQPNLGAYDLPLEPSIVKNNSKFSQSSETKVPESSLPFAEAAPIPSTESEDLMTFSCFEDRLGGSNIQNDSAHESSFNDEKLSASMQSLVDGLMNWGGGFEADEEHFTLPVGMAADIALESSHVLGSSFHV